MKKALTMVLLATLWVFTFNATSTTFGDYDDTTNYVDSSDVYDMGQDNVDYMYQIPANSGDMILVIDFTENTTFKTSNNFNEWVNNYGDSDSLYISTSTGTLNGNVMQLSVAGYLETAFGSSNVNFISSGLAEIFIPDSTSNEWLEISFQVGEIQASGYDFGGQGDKIEELFKLYPLDNTDNVDPVFTYSETEIDSPYNNPVTVTEIKNQLSVTDNIDGDLTSSIVVEQDDYSSVTPKVVGNTYNVIFSASDSAGNTAYLTVHITMVDEIDPYFTYNSTNYYDGGNITLPSWYDDSVSADKLTLDEIKTMFAPHDAYYSSGLLTYTATCPTANYYDIVGSHVVTLTLTDPSGNDAVFTVNVNVIENQNPVITGSSSQTVEVTNVNINSILPLYSATDTEDGSVSVVVSPNNVWNYNSATLGSFTLLLRATDTLGGYSEKSVTINVVDTTKPVFTFGDGTSNTVYLSNTDTLDTYLSTITASDSWYGDLTSSINFGADPSFTSTGNKTMNISVTDGSGNTQNATLTITVIDDIKPVINGTIKVVKGITATLTIAEIETGINAVDNIDGALSLTLVTDEYTASSGVFGVYDVVYKATDLSGNETLHTVKVWVVDNVAPVWIINDYFVILSENQLVTESELISLLESAGMIVSELSYTATVIDDTYFGHETESGTYTVTFNVLYEDQSQDVVTVSLTVPDTVNIPIIDNDIPIYQILGSTLAGIILVFGLYMIFKKRKRR